MTAFVVYDVFTDRPFGGNQLAVFPDASGLPDDKLQAIAAEFNFSETTFVYPPEQPEHTARVRIFTPTSELQFAGHPTIGTAQALLDLGHQGDMILELGVGPIPCTSADGMITFTTSAPLQRLSEPHSDLIAACLGLEGDHITFATHPPIEASLGTPFTLVEVSDLAALSACTPDVGAMRQAVAQNATTNSCAVLAYVRNGSHIDARMFAPLSNIPEDPATGSAAATLAALLHETLGADQDLTITQGVDMGRPSRILARTFGNPVQVEISGQAVLTMKGSFLA
ncbi:trans-2,3-dihydro-3-hydroxyanthranilate isomerase [Cognatiyoonia koreensis]|uniref:Trans-2,3-dihydro-3-hydroxyanthranilate isomerase n=1 Tax=Cognatiyoonia koreensis TaxID=364200 RepID=A0A1I0PJ57_9RHOB|nr:PhzF family phenazine biosynthesis protein [Cognatiyoonia koreensis]SEW14294.1 trans-2,3-dihydro-3-hydroxyanthranilate isomerase [Cognatiyoonia koreensis]